MYSNDEEIDLRQLFYIISKSLKLLITISVIFAIIAYFVSSYAIDKKYESSTTLLVNSNKLSSETITQNDVTLSKSLIYTYAEIAKSETIMDKTLKKLNIDEKQISALMITPLKDTQIIQIKAQAKSPELASDIANTVASLFSDEVKRIAKVDSVEIIDIAVPIYNSIYPSVVLNTLLSAFTGGMLALIIVFLKHFTDNTIKTESDVERYTDSNVLGTIIKYDTKEYEKSNLIMIKDSNSPICESYRNIKNSILFSNIDNNIKKIIVTSSTKSEGKSTLVANLAYALSEQELKVIVVDCDFRRPSIHRKFKLSNLHGITDILLNKDDYKDYIQKVDKNIDVLTSGKKPNNPAEVVSSKAISDLFDLLGKNYDYVLIDIPPLIVSDPLIMARIADGIIYVVQSGVAIKEIVKKNIEKLKLTNTSILGCVINALDAKKSQYGYYYYDSYYGEEKNKKSKNK